MAPVMFSGLSAPKTELSASEAERLNVSSSSTFQTSASMTVTGSFPARFSLRQAKASGSGSTT